MAHAPIPRGIDSSSSSPSSASNRPPNQPAVAGQRSKIRNALSNHWGKGLTGIVGATAIGAGVLWAMNTRTTPAEYVQGVLAQPQLNADGAANERSLSEGIAAFKSAQQEDKNASGLRRAGRGESDQEVLRYIEVRRTHALDAVEKLKKGLGIQHNPDSGTFSWQQWTALQNPDGGQLNQNLSAFNLYALALSLRWSLQPRSEWSAVVSLMLAEIRQKGWADFPTDDATCGKEGEVLDPNLLDKWLQRHFITAADADSLRPSLAAYCASRSFNPGALTDAHVSQVSDASTAATTPADAGPADVAVASVDAGLPEDAVVSSDVLVADAPQPTDNPPASNSSDTAVSNDNPTPTPGIANPPGAPTF
mgnify:CR=1 FL=1